MMNMISIVIPTYNERENITGLVDGIDKSLGRSSYEILFVDDQSSDGTAQVVTRLAKKNSFIRLLPHHPPRDLGRSILMGVEAVRGDVIVGMDGDGNHDPRYIPRLIEALRCADLVVGSRFVRQKMLDPRRSLPRTSMRGGDDKKGGDDAFRYWASLLFNAVLKYFFGFPIWDNTSGFYAIRKETLIPLDPPSIYYGYGEYHLRLVYKAMQQKLLIIEVPIVCPPRRHGQSKSRLGRMFVTYVHTAITKT